MQPEFGKYPDYEAQEHLSDMRLDKRMQSRNLTSHAVQYNGIKCGRGSDGSPARAEKAFFR